MGNITLITPEHLAFEHFGKLSGWVAAVDPGFKATGLAVGLARNGGLSEPVVDSIHVRPGTLNKLDFLVPITNQIILQIENAVPVGELLSHVVLESVELWAGSARSYASFIRGDALNILLLLGTVLGQLHWRSWPHNVRIWLVPPSKWRGQMPEGILKKRIADKLTVTGVNEHERDALGIWLAAQGEL